MRDIVTRVVSLHYKVIVNSLSWRIILCKTKYYYGPAGINPRNGGSSISFAWYTSYRQFVLFPVKFTR